MQPIAMPDFTVQQKIYLQTYISASIYMSSMDWKPSLNAAFNEYFGLPLSYLLPPQELLQSWYDQGVLYPPPTPQETKKEEAKEPLQQAISEEDTEDAEITAEKQEQQPLQQANAPQSNAPLYQTTMEDVEDDAEHGNSMTASKSMLSTKSRLCTAPTSGDQAACLSKALLFASQRTSSLASFGSLFGYIRCMEGMEASGQG